MPETTPKTGYQSSYFRTWTPPDKWSRVIPEPVYFVPGIGNVLNIGRTVEIVGKTALQNLGNPLRIQRTVRKLSTGEKIDFVKAWMIDRYDHYERDVKELFHRRRKERHENSFAVSFTSTGASIPVRHAFPVIGDALLAFFSFDFLSRAALVVREQGELKHLARRAGHVDGDIYRESQQFIKDFDKALRFIRLPLNEAERETVLAEIEAERTRRHKAYNRLRQTRPDDYERGLRNAGQTEEVRFIEDNPLRWSSFRRRLDRLSALPDTDGHYVQPRFASRKKLEREREDLEQLHGYFDEERGEYVIPQAPPVTGEIKNKYLRRR